MILNVTVARLRTIMNSFIETGTIHAEIRGGDRKLGRYEDKKRAVMSFINKFKCIESHYCRGSTSARMYLSSDFSIRKMFRVGTTNTLQRK